MEQVLTLVCKQQPTLEQSTKIDALLASFADGCNWTNETVKPSVTGKTTIQSLVYLRSCSNVIKPGKGRFLVIRSTQDRGFWCLIEKGARCQVYQTLREQFGLSANQAVRVCARVGASRKTAKLKGMADPLHYVPPNSVVSSKLWLKMTLVRFG